jgi:mono/diheme cytochrome c family protein
MKCKRVVVLGTVFLIAGTLARGSESGEALYKTKCAACHGASGEGKPAMHAPGLKGTKLDAGQIVERVTKGQPGARAPHNKGMASLKEDQAKAIAEYVKSF